MEARVEVQAARHVLNQSAARPKQKQMNTFNIQAPSKGAKHDHR